MKKRKLHIFMLAVLLTQSFGSTVSAFATTTTNIDQNSPTEQSADTSVEETSETNLSSEFVEPLIENLDKVTEEATKTNESDREQEASSPASTEQSSTESTAIPKTKETTLGAAIEDEILANMTITNMEGVEYNSCNGKIEFCDQR